MSYDQTLNVYAKTAETLNECLQRCRQGFELKQVDADACPDWQVVDGALQHRSKGFFSVIGLLHDGQEFVYLYQPQSAITGVLTQVVDNQRFFLLQARAEPGCVEEAQFGPTVQSTPANFLRFHGGKTTPYIGCFLASQPGITALEDTYQLDLGKRYYFKGKRSILIESEKSVELLPSFIWASPQAILESVGRSAFINTDLRSLLAVSPWSSREDNLELTPRSQAIRKSLDAPIRHEVLGRFLQRLCNKENTKPQFVPLTSLKNWVQTSQGWSECQPRQGFSIDFYEVKAKFREVTQWIQPLVNSQSEGAVILACREGSKGLEFFVRCLQEPGLCTGKGLAPSYLRYPGEVGEAPGWLCSPQAEIWASTIESDEGGRFLQDASRYQVVKVGSDAPATTDGIWMHVSELKFMLQRSNCCTIQLRCILSHLLGVVD
ncbi:MAG: NDP-hexose 2,3-dehydratase family protein [Cyanobacteria bacterium P01_H01_bin.15]